jgi:tRNA threonylcarbamoyladenosine biosynthesis protein TsaB
MLMPMIDSLLESLYLRPEDLKGIIVGHGPGSYTGVRVGVTAGKMMAWSLQIPIAGISTLDALAYHYQESRMLVCPMLDARRQQAYSAVYGVHAVQAVELDNDQISRFRKLQPDALRKLDQLFPLLEQQLSDRKQHGLPDSVLFLGDGAATYRQQIEERFQAQAHFSEDASRQLVRAAFLLNPGIARIEAGESDPVESFAPEYLQLVEAEAKLLQSQQANKGGCA